MAGVKSSRKSLLGPNDCAVCLGPCEFLPKRAAPGPWPCGQLGLGSNGHRCVPCQKKEVGHPENPIGHKDHKGRYQEVRKWST